jgi:hypothetical protein
MRLPTGQGWLFDALLQERRRSDECRIRAGSIQDQRNAARAQRSL